MVVTRTADSDRLLPDRVEATLKRWFVQFFGVLVFFSAIAGWLCLISWSVVDPTGDVARNMLGQYGAILADLMFQMLGLASIFFFLPIAVWGWYCISFRFPEFVALRLGCLAGFDYLSFRGFIRF